MTVKPRVLKLRKLWTACVLVAAIVASINALMELQDTGTAPWHMPKPSKSAKTQNFRLTGEPEGSGSEGSGGSGAENDLFFSLDSPARHRRHVSPSRKKLRPCSCKK